MTASSSYMKSLTKKSGQRIRSKFSQIPSLTTHRVKAVLFCFVLFHMCFRGFPFAFYGEKLCTRLLSQKGELPSDYLKLLRCMSGNGLTKLFRHSFGTPNPMITFIGDERHYWRFKALRSAFEKYTKEHTLPKMCFYRQDYLNSTLLDRIKLWTAGNSSVGKDRISETGEDCIDVYPTHLVLCFPLISCCANDGQINAESLAQNQKNLVTVLRRLRNVHLLIVEQDCGDSWCPCTSNFSMGGGRHVYNEDDVKSLKALKYVSVFRASRSIGYANGLRQANVACDDGRNSTRYTSYPYKAATLDGRVLSYALFDIGSECCSFVPTVNLIQRRLFILFLSATILAVVLRIPNLRFRSKPLSACVSTSRIEKEIPNGHSVLDCYYLLEYFTSISKFGLILLFFFIRERTIVYEKVAFGCTFWNFLTPLLLLLLIGVISVRPSTTDTFNNVDITREWKGWMQPYIVMCHYVQCPQIVPFACSRILVSAYLFLTGYGHFSYYWKQVPENYTISGLLKFQPHDIRSFGRTLWKDVQRYLTVSSSSN